jgi:hypothetical protein
LLKSSGLLNKQRKDSQEKHAATVSGSMLTIDNQTANLASNFKSSTKEFEICSMGTTDKLALEGFAFGVNTPDI